MFFVYRRFCGIKFALGAIAAYVRTESLYISGEV